jgi:hypothetical protein
LVSEHHLVARSFGRKGNRRKANPSSSSRARSPKENPKEELTEEGFGLAGKVRRLLRPRLFLSIPVRIGKPKHRTKNTGSGGASLRHGRKGRTPPGAKFALPSTVVVRRRRGKTERESRLKTRRYGARRRSPAGLRSVEVSSAKTEPPRVGQREREGRQ